MQEILLLNALSMKKLKDATDLEDDDSLEAHVSLKEDSPEKHTRWKCLALWNSNLEFDSVTEPTMHDFSWASQRTSLLMWWNGLPLQQETTVAQDKTSFQNFICHGQKWNLLLVTGLVCGFLNCFGIQLNFQLVLCWFVFHSGWPPFLFFLTNQLGNGQWKEHNGHLKSLWLSLEGKVSELKERQSRKHSMIQNHLLWVNTRLG